jgi:hypothetical protein
MGLENVRGRLRALHGDLAWVDVHASPDRYEIRLFIPWNGTDAPEAAAGPA